MIVALIDNGSLEPAAHRNLRVTARAIAAQAGVPVHAVSWKHSDRLRLAVLDHEPAWTLVRWVREQLRQGEREFVFIPYFISAQGAIGSALRQDLEKLQRESEGFSFAFTPGLAASGALPDIVAGQIRQTLAAPALRTPPVIVVDHGGPSAASAAIRDTITRDVRAALGAEIGPIIAASMEGAEHPHNHPLFADQLAAPGFDRGDVVIAPLFLAPGRHAGPRGDLMQIARAAEGRLASPPLRCHFTPLVGAHPRVAAVLATALRETLSTFHAEISA